MRVQINYYPIAATEKYIVFLVMPGGRLIKAGAFWDEKDARNLAEELGTDCPEVITII